MAFKLHSILRHKERETAAAKKLRSIGDLKRMIRDAPPLRSFKKALEGKFGIIAEIKRRSPSAGEMRSENVAQAPIVYGKSQIVKAVSVLTNADYFGMSVNDLITVKAQLGQPILRKDFITKEYEIYEARAFGADAVLLMANVLKADEMKKLFSLARELGIDVLFESHTKEEIDSIPEGAEIYGINSRRFMAVRRWHLANIANKIARFGIFKSGTGPDLTVELNTFSLIKHIPKHAIKVAESGIKPNRISQIIDLEYDAVLVGTSLLKSPLGIENALNEFAQEINPLSRRACASSVPTVA